MESLYIYKLKPWIDPNRIIYSNLSKNVSDGAIYFLKNNIDKINWYSFSANNNDMAVELLLQNIDKLG